MIKIEFSPEDIAQLRHERFHYPCPRVQIKMEVLLLKSHGLPHKDIQLLCQISSVTLASYLRQYIEGGIERLKLNLHKGKDNELRSHMETLKEVFLNNPPRSTKEAARIIQEHTGIERKLTQVRTFMRSMGLEYRKVASIPGKVQENDLAARQDKFKTEQLDPRIKEARKGERELFFWMPRILCTELF
jgi:transposase